ncbi:MAG: hypothetical protein C5S44_09730 [Candidatus Methanocomedens sp.]|nr:MAG: hypothetical protein C5S44_09730 [ANME-2 cluster archaeon]
MNKTNNDEPQWIKELKNKHKNDTLNKYTSIGLFLTFLFLFLLSFSFVLLIPDFIYAEDITAIIFIGLLLTFMLLLKNHYNYLNIDCLAYFLYKIGNNLSNPTYSDDYFKTNQIFLKKIMKIIRHYKPYKISVFSENTLDFFNNLELICLRLNFIYSNKSNHTTFTETKKNISANIMKLSESIKKEQSHLSSTHIDTITNIINNSSDVSIKPFESQFTHINIRQPQFLKIIEISVIIFLLTFFSSIKFVEIFLEPDSISYGELMIFSGTILASYLYYIKK